MECFAHEGRTSVGICRASLRGARRECAADLGGALACRGRCEAATALDQSVHAQEVATGSSDEMQQVIAAAFDLTQ